jgi:ketosteroid isomerase-like protein
VADSNVQLVREFIAAWNRQDLNALLERMHPDCELLGAESIQPIRGHDEFKASFGTWFEAFETFSADPDEFEVDGERVLAHVTQRGRGKASGVEVEQVFHQLFRLSDGLVIRFEEFADEADARRAFGA